MAVSCWLAIREGERGRIDVVPGADLRPHEAGPGCWCRPVGDADDPRLLAHNALDGREAFERGERKPS